METAPEQIQPPARTFETKQVLRGTYLSVAQHAYAVELTLFLLGVLFLGSFLYLMDIGGAHALMHASGEAVLGRGEYWRLFTAILAHGDLGHLLANCLLFVPFSIFLTRHFSPLFFPLAGVLSAAATNLLTLLTMKESTTLVGASGLVYWMGAAWITFYFLIEKRDRPALRLGKALMVGGVLFVPDVLRPNVSHMAHYVGALFGLFTALPAWWLLRHRIRAAERRELVILATPIEDGEWRNDQPPAWPS